MAGKPAGNRAFDGVSPISGERVAALRSVLDRQQLDGFILPRADAHQVEALPACAERLEWLTGFTGSMGLAAILADSAALFVDGRYTLQARSEVDQTLFEQHHVSDSPPARWLAHTLPKGGRIGYDPWLHTAAAIERMRARLADSGVVLIAMPSNPIDILWSDRPAPPCEPAQPHGEVFSGRPASAKRAQIADGLRALSLDAAALTSPESIAWLFNIRGGDVPQTPLTLAFAIQHADGTADLFVDGRKISPQTRTHLGNAVRLAPYEEFSGALSGLAKSGKSVLVDPATTPEAAITAITEAGGTVHSASDPCMLPRAIKNEVEIAGARAAHMRDAVAMVRFLHWLDRAVADAGTPVDELMAADKLADFRAEAEHYRGPSFETISGAGANGAIVHYRVNDQTNRRLEPGSFYLVDSGAQYLDGTTDITRTIAIGPINGEMRRHFTLVLKGHIALSRARFPAGTNGAQLDALARLPLWQAGLDFDHGTGHGIGSYLSVHEGPQRISKIANSTALTPGMIVSNEPGYYREGAYGIRSENLLLVTGPDDIGGGDRPMLGFEVLSLAPFDRNAIDVSLLSPGERDWIDAYHCRVLDVIGQQLGVAEREWLERATRPLGE